MREALAVAAGLEGEYLALTKSVHLLTYSRSGLQLLSRGQANQAMALAAEVWSLLNTLADSGIETVCSSGAGPCWSGRQRDRRPSGWRGFCGLPHDSLTRWGSVTLSQLRTGTPSLTRDTLHKISLSANEKCPACGSLTAWPTC